MKGTTVARVGGRRLIITGLFMYIAMINLVGLLPYLFPCTRHLFFGFRFGVPLVAAIEVSKFTYNPGAYLACLVPEGVPL